MSLLFLPASSPRDAADDSHIQKFIITGETKWHGDTGRSLQNTVQMLPSYYVFLLLLFLHQFNYSVNLINRYDCSACNLCARYLICSGSGRQGALAGIVFPLSWWPALQISCCRPHYFITEGDLRRGCVACFSCYYLTFFCSGGRQSWSSLLGSTWLEKLICGHVRPSLKKWLLHDVSQQELHKKGGLKMSKIIIFSLSFCVFYYHTILQLL